ncbi:hypothetical protein DFA_02892 [Cavenderia fasciculata]|uniref:Uncharacterized protein n=1 Tax=Cavenderia fasciculata TaxID=261658 RepID=F4PIR9_CACFS|nr:uncharacterized protein DFA_02892 [Cavenderia fasciculata]EGG24648.1 hypothetical protein DFA_02892 [Cavenderia fasciculata]|eukprot:XP_004362499.1 hypothetical protein DFA_02892 [Cavenderia fasciculata]
MGTDNHDHSLATGVQSLSFGDGYNQEISVGVLPSSLQSLSNQNKNNITLKVMFIRLDVLFSHYFHGKYNSHSSKYKHLFYQIEKTLFKERNQLDPTDNKKAMHIEYPLKDMDELFKLDNDNIHQMFEHDHQYLNIRFIPVPTEQDIGQNDLNSSDCSIL